MGMDPAAKSADQKPARLSVRLRLNADIALADLLPESHCHCSVAGDGDRLDRKPAYGVIA
jgi:hypothetical protein